MADHLWSEIETITGRYLCRHMDTHTCPFTPHPSHPRAQLAEAGMWSVLQSRNKPSSNMSAWYSRYVKWVTKRNLWALILCTLREKNNDHRGTALNSTGENHYLSPCISTFMSWYWLFELELSLQQDWITLLGEVLCSNIFLSGVLLHRGWEPLL